MIKMKEMTMRKVFLLLAAGLLLATSCNQMIKVKGKHSIKYTL